MARTGNDLIPAVRVRFSDRDHPRRVVRPGALRRRMVAGMTTLELDQIAEDNIRSSGAAPSFKGYHGFTGSICASVNDEVVHGIPGDRVLEDGDVISIDCGAIVDGWHGDAAITVAIGEVPEEALELMRVTEEAMWRGFAAARLGGSGFGTAATLTSAASRLHPARFGIERPRAGERSRPLSGNRYCNDKQREYSCEQEITFH